MSGKEFHLIKELTYSRLTAICAFEPLFFAYLLCGSLLKCYLSREICITWVGLKDQLLVIKPVLGCLNICLVSGLLMLTLWAVGFSYAKWGRNHCEQPSAFPSSMCEFVTRHVIHLMSISFVNLFFAWSVCTKERKFLAKSADKRMIHTFIEVMYIFSFWSTYKAQI